MHTVSRLLFLVTGMALGIGIYTLPSGQMLGPMMLLIAAGLGVFACVATCSE